MPVREEKERRGAEEQGKKIFIGGLTSTTTEEHLTEFYNQWGEIVDCVVMKDPTTKRSRGFGFVTFAEQSSVDAAMTHRPHEIDGKAVEPKRAIPRDASGKAETNMSVKRLYVSGIKDDHSEESIREYFSQYGNVETVEIITDKNTGKRRGFAFINFDDYDPVDKCVLQKSHMIENKRCDVKKALSRDEMQKAEMTRERLERDGRSRGTARGAGWGDSYGHAAAWDGSAGPWAGNGSGGGYASGYGQGGYGGYDAGMAYGSGAGYNAPSAAYGQGVGGYGGAAGDYGRGGYGGHGMGGYGGPGSSYARSSGGGAAAYGYGSPSAGAGHWGGPQGGQGGGGWGSAGNQQWQNSGGNWGQGGSTGWGDRR